MFCSVIACVATGTASHFTPTVGVAISISVLRTNGHVIPRLIAIGDTVHNKCTFPWPPLRGETIYWPVSSHFAHKMYQEVACAHLSRLLINVPPAVWKWILSRASIWSCSATHRRHWEWRCGWKLTPSKNWLTRQNALLQCYRRHRWRQLRHLTGATVGGDINHW